MRVIDTQPIASIQSMEVQGDAMHLSGWIVHREYPLTHVTLRAGPGLWTHDVPLSDRPDVCKNLYPEIGHTAVSGFNAVVPWDPNPRAAAARRLEIIAKSGEAERGTVSVELRDLDPEPARFPVPPSVLKRHVGGRRDDFLSTGWRIYSDLKGQVARLGGWARFDRIHDWGCGCGRVFRYLYEEVPAPCLFGCDIDREAVRWMSENARGSSFEAIRKLPPTPYADEQFALVYGISIFTHLNEAMQDRWLGELNRINRPGGVVAVSVHGPELVPRRLRPRLRKRGFADVGSRQAFYFVPYAGLRYYRTAYHTPRYVEEHWSRYFDVLEYFCRAVNAHQDLVIMRKR
jgi:SAM-dependent methyltransferase